MAVLREVTETALRKVALLGGATPILRQCQTPLREYATVEPGTLTSAGEQRWDLVLLALPERVDAAVVSYARARAKFPATPLILLGADLDADTAVELIKCGADDYLSLPIDAGALGRKVRRAIGSFDGPAFDRPELSPLKRTQSSTRNRRHCYRATLSDDFSLQAIIRAEAGSISARVVNLSIKTEGWLGGMLLELPTDARERLPADVPTEGQPLPITVVLSDGDDPIPLRTRVVLGGLRSSPEGLELVAVQYQTRGPADEGRFQAIWLDAQRAQRLRR
jgi:CheY-like chemotaxis protein